MITSLLSSSLLSLLGVLGAPARAQDADVRGFDGAYGEPRTKWRTGGRAEGVVPVGSDVSTAGVAFAADLAYDVQSWLSVGGSLGFVLTTRTDEACASGATSDCFYRGGSLLPFVELRSPGEGIVSPWARASFGPALLVPPEPLSSAFVVGMFSGDVGIDFRAAGTTFGPYFTGKVFTARNTPLIGGGARVQFTF